MSWSFNSSFGSNDSFFNNYSSNLNNSDIPPLGKFFGQLALGGLSLYLDSQKQRERGYSSNHDDDLYDLLSEKKKEVDKLKEECAEKKRMQEESDKKMAEINKQKELEKEKQTKAETLFRELKLSSIKEYRLELLKNLKGIIVPYLTSGLGQLQKTFEIEALVKQIADNEKVVQSSEHLIEEIAKTKGTGMIESMKHFNIVLEGKSGVGKSTMVNAFLRLVGTNAAKTGGGGKPVTLKQSKFESPSIPTLRLWDNRGIELAEHCIDKTFEDLFAFINAQALGKQPDQYIHAIWYCIAATGNRIEESEISALTNVMKLYEGEKLPIIIVLTQTYDEKEGEAFKANLKEMLPSSIDVVPVVAFEKYKKEPYGFNELLNVTAEKSFKSTGSACYYSIKLQLQEELKKLEADLRQKAEQSVTQTISQVKKERGRDFTANLNKVFTRIIQCVATTFVSLNKPGYTLSVDTMKLIDKIKLAFSQKSHLIVQKFAKERLDLAQKEILSRYSEAYKKIEKETGYSLPLQTYESEWIKEGLKVAKTTIEETAEFEAFDAVANHFSAEFINVIVDCCKELFSKALTNKAKVIEDIAMVKVNEVTHKILTETMNYHFAEPKKDDKDLSSK